MPYGAKLSSLSQPLSIRLIASLADFVAVWECLLLGNRHGRDADDVDTRFTSDLLER